MTLLKSRFTPVRLYAVVLCVLCAACEPQNTITPTVARTLSAPTLEASPTVDIKTSDELYGESDVNSGQLEPTAASLPPNSSLPPLVVGTPNEGGHQSVHIILEDGTQLTGDLYQRGFSRVPGVLLLAPDKESWGFLPVRLYTAGMTVLVVEARENPQPGDMDVLLISLSEIGTVDPGLMAVVGAERGAEMALSGCATNGICDAVVLLSPSNRDALLDAMKAFSPRPVLVATGEDDAVNYTTSVAVASAASGTSQLLTYPTGKGTALLELQPDLVDTIVDWLAGQFPVFVPEPAPLPTGEQP